MHMYTFQHMYNTHGSILTVTGKHIQAHMCTFNTYAHISTCVQHTHLHTEFNNTGTHIKLHTHIYVT